jgi:c-di-AMP phosphodiesterase-like protein
LIFEKRDLKQAVETKFSILQEINAVTSATGVEATISIGLGVDGATFEEGYEFAALSIEMALSRGGDQAVVKDRMNFNFYGGRTKEADQRNAKVQLYLGYCYQEGVGTNTNPKTAFEWYQKSAKQEII